MDAAAAPTPADARTGRPGLGCRLLLVALAVLALLYFLSYHDHGIAPFDEGLLTQGIRLQADGRMDVAKFHHYSVKYRFFATLFPSGEANLEVIRLVWAAVRAATAVLIALVACRLMPWAWSLLPAGLFLALPGPAHKSFVPFLLCLAVHAMLRASQERRTTDHAWLGISLSVAIAFHPYTGVLLVAAWAAVVFFNPGLRPVGGSGTGRRRHGAHLAFVLCLIGGTGLLADYLHKISPMELLLQNVRLIRSIGAGSTAALTHQLAGLPSGEALVVASMYGIGLLATGAALVAGLRRTGDLNPRTRDGMLVLAIVTVANLPKWLVRLDVAHFLQLAPPVWIVLAFFIRRLCRDRESRPEPQGVSAPKEPIRHAAGVLLALWVIGAIAFGLTSPRYPVGSIGLRLSQETAPLEHPHGVLHVDRKKARRLNRLVRAVRRSSGEGDAVLVLAKPLIVNHLTGRASPIVAPSLALPASFATNPESELIRQIRCADTALILFRDRPIIPLKSFSLRNMAPRLYAMLMEDYALVETADGVQIRRLRVQDKRRASPG